MRNHLAEYLAGAPDLLEYYASPPAALFERPPTARAWDAGLVGQIRTYNESIGGTASFEGDEAVVITGQQPGLFTGPLYSIYKAATAVRLAERLQETTGVRCVPIFWVGSEDHDFDEARRAHFLTKSRRTLTFDYSPSAPVDGLPMYRVPLDETVHGAIDEASAETPGSEFRGEVTEFLHASLDESDSLADWTARLMARLFRDTALVFFSPHLVEARRAGAPIIERELRDPLTSMKLLNDTGTALEKAGFAPQIVKGAGECGFFLEIEGRRRKVLFEAGAFHLPEEECSFSRDEMVALLASAPERFSPNVGLRCIVQQHLFPTAAYVAGPGELAYWAQLKPVFAHHGLPMPIVYPRARCAMTTMKLNKTRKKLGLDLSALQQPEDAIVAAALRNVSQDPAYVVCQEERGALEEATARFAKSIEGKDKAAGEMAARIVRDLSLRLDKLEAAILRASESKNGAVREQIRKLTQALAPERRAQERYFCIFSFVFEHGWGLVPRIIRELDVESFTMNEIEL